MADEQTTGDVARRIAGACRARLEASGLDPAAVDRLTRYACRHLPIAESTEGSAFIPPLYAMRVCASLGVPVDLAVEFAAAGCLFFAAADLADDCADGDVRRSVGLDVNDTCHLLFAQQQAVLALPVSGAVRLALCQLMADAGQEMACGQALDLEGSDALQAADPLTIAVGKTGGELAAFFAGPALLAGQAPAPWRAFGRAVGALVQVLTDYLDLFLDSTSDDWEAAKPTIPIRHGMDHPEHGESVRLLLCGDRAGADRKARGLWHLVQSGAAKAFQQAIDTLIARMRTAESDLDQPPVLACIREELVDWCEGVVEALEEYRADAAPAVIGLAREVELARQSAHAFLACDPGLDEATEVHRHGLFDAPVVKGGLFGRALAIDALAGEGLDTSAARAAAFELADADGWRYYPGHLVLPTDIDCIGVMMQIADTPALRAHPAHDAGWRRVSRVDNGLRSGLVHTWLADGERHQRADIDATWAGACCAGAMANLLVGLWRWGNADQRAWALARLPALADEVLGGHESAFYPAPVVDYMVTRCFLELGADTASTQAAIDAIVRRTAARRTASGQLGNPLETALGAWILARLDRAERPDELRRGLVDAQGADGGYSADPLYRTVPHPVTAWYGSRVVTTAYVLQALRALS